MKADKAFEKCLAERNEDESLRDQVGYSDALYFWKQSRIDTLDWIQNEIKELPEGGVDGLLIFRIDTELEKLKDA